jgi:hexose-6-phosphate dehydrogenase
VVLVGATGDLSKKYLWQALYRLHAARFMSPTKVPTLRVWPGSRATAEKGQAAIGEILKKHLICKPGVDYILDDELAECETSQENFVNSHVRPYTRLKKELDYAELNSAIQADMEATDAKEVGRIVYLSIPPKAYENASRAVSEHAHPSSRPRSSPLEDMIDDDVSSGNTNSEEENVDLEDPWLRVIFEKPFGSDTDSAEDLAQVISDSLVEREIYRIDHYLGKAGVQGIHDFRRANAAVYEPLFSNEHVARIDVVMKEKVDCAGRAGYYDDYGVIRDIHQNHLSEMLALATMDLTDSDDINDSEVESLVGMMKSYVYDSISPPTLEDAVLGQYAEYQHHVEEDRSKWIKDEAEITAKTMTPTYAAVRLNIDTDRWNGVPVIVTAGKALDERTAYVRFIFKSGGELMFNVQGGAVGTAISATSDLPAFQAVPGWSGTSHNISPGENPGAYDSLVAAAFHGKESLFVQTDTLLASWRVWTPLLHAIEALEKPPMAYGPGGKEVFAESSKLFKVSGSDRAPKEL